MTTAFITGITGQDGSYLAEDLLELGYRVVGMVRRSSNMNRGRIDHLRNRVDLSLVYGDITDASVLHSVFNSYNIDEVYHLASQSNVQTSFQMPEYTTQVIVEGTLKLLEAVRQSKNAKSIRMYNASSSEMFGNHMHIGLKPSYKLAENSKFRPISPYAIAKVAAHHMAEMYRKAYGLFICSGILFNHESPRRGEQFVTRKITKAVKEIGAGSTKRLKLGNINARRDWGYAPDYVKAMWLMLQQNDPRDYVIATGENHSVIDFLQAAFEHMGIAPYEAHIDTDEAYMRPLDLEYLCGDASKAQQELGWAPTVTFERLVKMMVDAEVAGEVPRYAQSRGTVS